MEKLTHCKVTYTAEIISIHGKAINTASVGKKLLSHLMGFNDVKMKIEKDEDDYEY